MKKTRKARILAAAPLRLKVARRLKGLISRAGGSRPTLAIVSVSPLARSNVYIREKEKFAREIGAKVERSAFSRRDSAETIRKAIRALNRRRDVHGIILQLPIPRTIKSSILIEEISPEKDVDGLGSVNVKALWIGEKGTRPATARGIIELLDYYKISIGGRQAVVIGRSALVGKPIAHLLLDRDATVTICHSRTRDLEKITRVADILVVAAGVPRLVRARGMQKEQVIVDVGITAGLADEGGSRVKGDVDFGDASRIVGAVTPVPGGVGPMTVAALFENLVETWERGRAARR